MKPEEFPRHRAEIAPFLPADFPRRVIERAHVVEHRRVIRRRIAMTSLPLAAAAMLTLIALPILRATRSAQTTIASAAAVTSYNVASAESSDEMVAQWSDETSAADDTVTGVMFPDMKTVSDFDNSYQSDSWRFYNPSWPQVADQ